MFRFVSYYWRQGKELGRELLPALPAWLRILGTREKKRCYLFFSKGMEKIPHLDVYLGAPVLRLPTNGLAERVFEHIDCLGVLVWGRKEQLQPLPLKGCLLKRLWRPKISQARFAVDFAKRHNLPLLRLEDGFIRSLDLGVLGGLPHSLIIDPVGVYYDARFPSSIEERLNSNWKIPNVEEAKKALSLLLTLGISKYNNAPNLPAHYFRPTQKKRILVVDQTLGDLSISLGLAQKETFALMLEAACQEHPNDLIYVKVHPDVLSGKKSGNIAIDNLPPKVTLLAFDCAPLSLLAWMDEVYVVTSQMGFEALLLGKKVHCFGMPFYAGFGETIDSISCARRVKKRSTLEIFACAYLQYAQYVSPALGERVGFAETVQELALKRQKNEANSGFHACLGFSGWKHAHARAFLSSTRGSVAFYDDTESAVRAAKSKGGAIVVWASKMPDGLLMRCRETAVPLLRMEDGFVRSIGLGSDFYRPGSLVVDDLGIYYDPSRPSRLEVLAQEDVSLELLETARMLRELLVSRGVSKYNMVGERDLPPLPQDQKILLVPGQVEDDASVRLGGLGIHSNTALLKQVRLENPDAYILYKEHPDVVSGNRLGAVSEEAIKRFANARIRTTPIEQVLPLVSEVHTLTSLTGFEALLRGIPVVTYGGPFYAGFGLTSDHHTFARRKPLASLEHLICAALLRYPTYYDWQNRQIVSPLTFVNALVKAREERYSKREQS